MTQDAHEGENEGETHGMALGFRIFESDGEMFFVEAEIASYVDDPDALGATLVFHRLTGIDPAAATVDDELDWDSWPVDLDDELSRDEKAPRAAQFEAILRQLSGLSEDQLHGYLKRAIEEANADLEGDEE